MSETRYRHARRLAQRRIAGELFVVDPAHRCLHQPQGAGDTFWDWLGDGASVPELVERAAEEFDAPRAQLEKDVRKFVRELLRKKLLEAAS
jgi:hypothetical protein